nr:Clp protease N-terminal domain-containing protein [Micromonospora sp. DSM 115978]
MFERFTRDARSAVSSAAQAASELGHPRVDTAHLLLGVCAQGGRTGAVLAGLGVDPQRLRAELARARASTAGPDGLDADALSTLGIDADAVRRAADARFGPGALSAAASRRMPRGRRRWPRGHVPFATESKR